MRVQEKYDSDGAICVECSDVQFFTGAGGAAALKSVRPEANARLAQSLDALLTA